MRHSLSAAAPSLGVNEQRWHPSTLRAADLPQSRARGRSGPCARLGEVDLERQSAARISATAGVIAAVHLNDEPKLEAKKSTMKRPAR